eukprot:6207633-Pleurochrysis_carterae.AAC.3
MCSNVSRMIFVSAGLQLQNGLFRSKSKTCSGDAVQLGQNAPSRCLTRRAEFLERGGSGKRAALTCGLDDQRCNDAFQAGLAQGR